MKKIAIFFISVVVIVSTFFWYFNQTPSTIYQVKKNENITSIAKNLADNNIIASPFVFKLLAKIKNTKPKIGYYTFHNIWQFLDDIHSATSLSGFITFVPGKTTLEYYNTLRLNKYIHTTKSLQKIMQELDIPKPYEGRFLPETYHFNYGDSAKSIFKKSYELMNKKLKIFKKNKYIQTPYQLLILASIIEKESGNTSESAKIAGVFINRLKKNMRLQSDATTIYGMGAKYKGKITKKDLRTKNNYNTYKIKGLPMGAITNPSLSSIVAANNPEKHQLLYFVAKNSKEHIFAKTYKQHRENIKKYILGK